MEDIDERIINELASLCGLIDHYWDILGNRHTASLASKIGVLKAMGIDTDSALKEINLRKGLPWTRLIEPVYVLSIKANPISIPIHLACEPEDIKGASIKWYLSPKGNIDIVVTKEVWEIEVAQDKYIEGTRYIRSYLRVPTEGLKLGYYQIEVIAKIKDKSIKGKSTLIICPERCYTPPIWQSHTPKRLWGLSLNLYSLRSERNWGVGDLGDLRLCIKEVSHHGGAFVGINPLHAISNQRPFGVSPYSPTSRLFRNYLYIDIDGLREIGLTIPKGIDQEARSLRQSEFIDYEAVAILKLKVLREIFESFYKGPDSQLTYSFRQYLQQEGQLLYNFATYCAIAEHEGRASGKPLYSWRQWDRGFHRPDSEEVLQFKKENQRAILFYCFIQWLLDRQLNSVSEEARQMSIGIYNDLAVGSVRDGYDEWAYQGILATTANAGAPPDDFNPKGQNWGFPPLNPFALREAAYEPFIQCLRKNMQHVGALRIDHALGLFRTFWIPFDLKPSEGVYVAYPWQDLLGIIALESELNKTIIIAEDLGTVTDQARQALSAYNMLSYRLLYFQRNYPDPSFVPPDNYPDMALCTVTTHDLPTLNGFWIGRDIELRNTLSLFKTQEDYLNALRDRQRDKALLIEALVRSGILPEGYSVTETMIPQLLIAIYEYLARSRSLILALSLDDLMGTLDQQNMPGTVEEYPSWIQKTPISIEELFSGQTFLGLSRILNRYRQDH